MEAIFAGSVKESPPLFERATKSRLLPVSGQKAKTSPALLVLTSPPIAVPVDSVEDTWSGEPQEPRVQHVAPLAADRLRHDQGCEDCRREQLHGAEQARLKPPPRQEERTDRLDCDRPDSDGEDRDPGRAQRGLRARTAPMRHALAAAMIGTPAGATGTAVTSSPSGTIT